MGKLSYMKADNSYLSAYNACPRECHNRYDLGLAHEVKGLGLWSSNVLHPMLADYNLHGLDLKGHYEEVDDIYSLRLAADCLNKYASKFPADPRRVESCEKVYGKNIGRHHYFAKIDVLHVEGDVRVVGDYKASGWYNSPMDFHRQLLGGLYASGGTKTRYIFFHINTARGRNQGTLQDIYVWDFEPTQEMMREWMDETILLMDQAQMSKERNVWPKMAPGACFKYGQKYKCPFLDVCGSNSDPGLIESMPKADPWAYLGQE